MSNHKKYLYSLYFWIKFFQSTIHFIIFYKSMGKKDCKWLWMDKKCFNEENTLFFRALKLLKIDIKRYQEMDDLSEDLEELSE